jgi:hypothetical protein
MWRQSTLFAMAGAFRFDACVIDQQAFVRLRVLKRVACLC